MNDLSLLKAKLHGLRLRRAATGWLAALAALLAIALGGLIVAFLLDVALHLGTLERLVVLLAWVTLSGWSLYRFVWPMIRRRESLVELALLVEQQHGIKSELVAALQFDDMNRKQYGLADLRAAVVSDTAELSGDLNYRHPGLAESMRKNLIAAAGVVAVAVVLSVIAGDYVQAFANRFLLGQAKFPTDTQIRLLTPGDRVAYGQPIPFRVEVAGELPGQGQVRLVGAESGDVAIVELTPDANDDSIYTGRMRRALEDCTYVVEVGDARLGPQSLVVVPLPKVSVAMKVETPAYAAGRYSASQGRQSVTLVGSRVTPVVTSDKKLRSATIRINGKTYDMRPSNGQFVLETEALKSVKATLQYEVEVEDVDGLHLERPITGVLRVREDRAPRISGQTVTRQVLPVASPSIRFTATDDFGLQRIVLHRKVIRGGKSAATVEPPPVVVMESPKHALNVDRSFNLPLAELKLVPGDRVVCSLQAVDYRGSNSERTTESEPIVFEVTDRNTLLKSLQEADAKIDKELERIIRIESGLGENR